MTTQQCTCGASFGEGYASCPSCYWPVAKGEGPGHPFRGNQYVSGKTSDRPGSKKLNDMVDPRQSPEYKRTMAAGGSSGGIGEKSGKTHLDPNPHPKPQTTPDPNPHPEKNPTRWDLKSARTPRTAAEIGYERSQRAHPEDRGLLPSTNTDAPADANRLAHKLISEHDPRVAPKPKLHEGKTQAAGRIPATASKLPTAAAAAGPAPIDTRNPFHTDKPPGSKPGDTPARTAALQSVWENHWYARGAGNGNAAAGTASAPSERRRAAAVDLFGGSAKGALAEADRRGLSDDDLQRRVLHSRARAARDKALMRLRQNPTAFRGTINYEMENAQANYDRAKRVGHGQLFKSLAGLRAARARLDHQEDAQ